MTPPTLPNAITLKANAWKTEDCGQKVETNHVALVIQASRLSSSFLVDPYFSSFYFRKLLSFFLLLSN